MALFIFAKIIKMNIAVLGAGMVGRVMAIDLANQHSVTSVDVNETNLAISTKTKCSNKNY